MPQATFLFPQTLSGSSPLKKKKNIKRAQSCDRTLFMFGPLEGTRTPVLQNRNLLRYPAAPRAESLLHYTTKSEYLQVIFPIMYYGDVMKKRSIIITVLTSLVICFGMMVGVALLLLPAVIGTTEQKVSDQILGVDYGKTPENEAVLILGEKDSGALIYLDFENSLTHVYLFTEKAQSEAVKLPYNIGYTLNFSENLTLKLCDRLGGIDIENKGEKTKYFSASLKEYLDNSTENDKLLKISLSFFEKIAKTGLSSEDFMFIIEESNTALPYSVCYGWSDRICEMFSNTVFY